MRILPQPASPPVPTPGLLAMLKSQIRADGGDEDAMLYGYAAAALAHVEQLLGRMVTQRAAAAVFDCWPSTGEIMLLAPVTSIVSLVAGGVAFTGFVLRTSPGGIQTLRPASGQSWPTLAPDATVVLTVLAGWDVLPEPMLQAVLMLAAHFYMNREAIQVGDRAAAIELPFGVRDLLRPYRWTWIG